MRALSLLSVLISLAVAPLGAPSSRDAETGSLDRRPNVVILFADDLKPLRIDLPGAAR